MQEGSDSDTVLMILFKTEQFSLLFLPSEAHFKYTGEREALHPFMQKTVSTREGGEELKKFGGNSTDL